MTWPDTRWHDRCTNCGHERCDHEYPKKGDPCHTCDYNGNLLGGPVCQRFEEKAKLREHPFRDSRVKYGLDATLLALLVVYGARGVTALFKIIWWITKTSAIGTAYGYQVWWWILTGRGSEALLATLSQRSPPMLTMDGSDLSEASAPAGQLSPQRPPPPPPLVYH